MRWLPGILLLASFAYGFGQAAGDNTVTGKIILPEKQSLVVQGSGYNKDGSRVMHSDHPMADPENNVIVYFLPTTFEPVLEPLSNASITQQEQTFLPHVLPITTGTTVYLLNEDEFFHNIYSLTPGSRFNIGRRPPGSPFPIKIKRSGAIKLSCDIHPHMEGYILSLRTPYFTRIRDDGTYILHGLPDGTYRVEAFHPVKGMAVFGTVELTAGITQKWDINWKSAGSP